MLSDRENFVRERKNIMVYLILSQRKDLRAGLIWEDFGALTITCERILDVLKTV